MTCLFSTTRRSFLAAMALLAVVVPAHAADTSRVVSIGGAVTEILYALGHDKEIVGVDSTSLYPPRAMKEKANVGYMRQLSAEGVLGLNPSVVIAIEGAGPKETMNVLEAAKVPLVIVPDSYSEVGIVEKINVIARVTGATEPAKCLTARVRADLDALETIRAGIGDKKKRVLFVLSLVNGRAMAAGTHTAADGIIRLAGATNVIGDYEGYKQLTDEAVIAARPDVILSIQRGGPGVLAADWANRIGLELGKLSPAAAEALKPQLAECASVADLVDLSEDATPEHYAAAIRAANADPGVDGMLAIHSPKAGGDPVAAASGVAAVLPQLHKPLLACWMGDATVAAARTLLNDGGVASFRTPEAAVGAFGNIATFYQNQRLLQQTPPPLTTLAKPDIEGARLLVDSVLAERRKVLTEMESKTLLSAFHVPVTQTLLARSPNEAMMIATQLGFPVALKIDSPDIVHKSDVQGVALNVMTGAGAREIFADMVERVGRLAPGARINGVTVQKMARARRGREVSVGVVSDDPFGPVIVFGAGGVMVELIADRAMELPPLNQFLARRLVERARVAETLLEWRGASAADVAALERLLLRVSEMVCALPQLREMDLNPVIVDEHGAVAVDARVVVDSAPAAAAGAAGQFAHLAILPYPSRHEQVWPLRGGETVLVRPIRPDDAQMLQALVRGLTPESRHFRFVSSFAELPASMLSRFTLIDYDREMALVAVVRERAAADEGEAAEGERIVGVSRYVIRPDQTSCEFSLVVAEDMKGRGLGSRLMESIMEVARERGLSEIMGLVLRGNAGMLKLMRGLGFSVKRDDDDPDFVLVRHPL